MWLPFSTAPNAVAFHSVNLGANFQLVNSPTRLSLASAFELDRRLVFERHSPVGLLATPHANASVSGSDTFYEQSHRRSQNLSAAFFDERSNRASRLFKYGDVVESGGLLAFERSASHRSWFESNDQRAGFRISVLRQHHAGSRQRNCGQHEHRGHFRWCDFLFNRIFSSSIESSSAVHDRRLVQTGKCFCCMCLFVRRLWGQALGLGSLL